MDTEILPVPIEWRQMGFELWVEGNLAWAQGTYEYRPMGVAVIAATDLFRPRDFHPRRRPPLSSRGYLGQFASLGALNQKLRSVRFRTPATKPKLQDV